jgi:hypothetical protein
MRLAAMIHIDFTPGPVDAPPPRTLPSPHPGVQPKMEAVYLKFQTFDNPQLLDV